jgi:uncharacterized ion transporter superfamily protein YfcC
MVLLLGAVMAAALLTWMLPAGAYERELNQTTGRDVVVPGTFHRVEATPVGPAAAVLAVPRGIVAGADVIVVILFVGGAFAMLEGTGALGRLVAALVGRTTRPRSVVVAVSLFFAILGVLQNMHEEIIALVPVLVLLSRGLGFGALTALGMSVGAAVTGSAFGPTNPFSSGIANRFSDLPLGAGFGMRSAVTVAAVTVWILYVLWQARRDTTQGPDNMAEQTAPATKRDVVMLWLLIVPFVPYVAGVMLRDWGFNELSAVFLVAACCLGLTAGLGVRGTAVAYLKGMETMLSAALLIGVARAISVVLTDGQVIDTIVYGLSRPLEHVPGALAAGLMVPVHMVLHVPVMSNSGHAALVMPIMAPLADLLGFSREIAVLAFQTGGPTMDLLVPTNGALLAMLVAAGVPYSRWLRYAVPGMLLVILVGLLGIGVSFALG